MLFSNQDLDGISAGRITLAFRRWKAPRVKPGSRMRTAIGVIEVVDVGEVDPDSIDPADVAAAGFPDRPSLDRWIEAKPGRLFRIELKPGGPDPRIALRRDSDFDAETAADLIKRLGRMDAAAPRPWTWQTLHLIDERPGVVSTELAAQMGEERKHFKNRVRRLKELGLTESLQIGYRLSPRGRALL
ncbi:MAG TPA: hypothetical protein VJ938_12975, partial [Acidimicrobiia bacterium]|nr:hypothetical protein [Acidimicrobiia bacterium]